MCITKASWKKKILLNFNETNFLSKKCSQDKEEKHSKSRDFEKKNSHGKGRRNTGRADFVVNESFY